MPPYCTHTDWRRRHTHRKVHVWGCAGRFTVTASCPRPQITSPEAESFTRGRQLLATVHVRLWGRATKIRSWRRSHRRQVHKLCDNSGLDGDTEDKPTLFPHLNSAHCHFVACALMSNPLSRRRYSFRLFNSFTTVIRSEKWNQQSFGALFALIQTIIYVSFPRVSGSPAPIYQKWLMKLRSTSLHMISCQLPWDQGCSLTLAEYLRQVCGGG